MSEGVEGPCPTQNAPPSMRRHCGQGPPRDLDAQGDNAAPTVHALPPDPRAAGDGVSSRVSSTAARLARMAATALSIAASSGGASCALLSFRLEPVRPCRRPSPQRRILNSRSVLSRSRLVLPPRHCEPQAFEGLADTSGTRGDVLGDLGDRDKAVNTQRLDEGRNAKAHISCIHGHGTPFRRRTRAMTPRSDRRSMYGPD